MPSGVFDRNACSTAATDFGRPTATGISTCGNSTTRAAEDAQVDEPGRDALCDVGTLALVVQHEAAKENLHHAVCQGLQRFRLLELVEGYPFLAARIERIAEAAPMSTRLHSD